MKAWTSQKKPLIAKADFDLPLTTTSNSIREKLNRLPEGGGLFHIRRADFLIILETADKNILHSAPEKVD